MSNHYHDDPVKKPAARRLLPKFIAACALMLFSLVYYQTTFAAKITMNSNRTLELGQGIVTTGPCTGSAELDVIPRSTFVNADNGGGTYYLSSVKVAGIPASCQGKDFNLRFYNGVSGSSALPIFSFQGLNKSVATINNTDGYFLDGFKSVISANGSFTVTFSTPVALATDIMKMTLETTARKPSSPEPSFSSIAYHTCALLSTGGVKCWGYNQTGQLGNGNTNSTSRPGSAISSLTSGVIQISAGLDYTCALLATGTVRCWGGNSWGQLGDGTTTQRSTPVDVKGLSDVIAITTGNKHACALLGTGGVKCWGQNHYGQLGNGTTTLITAATSTPQDVSNLSSGVTAIGAGALHTCAVLGTGAAKCWGYNSLGEFGNGTAPSSSSIPVNVSGLSAGDLAVAIALGEEHTCILLINGRVKCSGEGFEGQLGNGGIAASTTPVAVSSITNAVAISAGRWHNCALLSTGGVRCWGFAANGQLGDSLTGSGQKRLTPVTPLIGGVTPLNSGYTAISASLEHSCAVLSTGAAKCWGQGANGRLGDGTTVQKANPVDVLDIP